MNRGAGRQPVFRTTRDRLRFIDLLAEGVTASTVELHAFALMGNHYHLILHCPDGGLSDLMHRLGSMYTRYVNWRLERDGPLFRGRFHSVLVDTPEYLNCAGRYVHRNPLDLWAVTRLDEYPWSSYRYYVDTRPRPEWLTTEALASMHDGPDGYRAFVEGSVPAETASVEWAIDTAMMEFGDRVDLMTPHVRRAVLLAMSERADDAPARALAQLIAFPSPTARRMALQRLRRRIVAQPVLADVAARALELVA